jgi:hypothetical protein
MYRDNYQQLCAAIVECAARDAVTPGVPRGGVVTARRFLRDACQEDGYARLIFDVAGIDFHKICTAVETYLKKKKAR